MAPSRPWSISTMKTVWYFAKVGSAMLTQHTWKFYFALALHWEVHPSWPTVHLIIEAVKCGFPCQPLSVAFLGTLSALLVTWVRLSTHNVSFMLSFQKFLSNLQIIWSNNLAPSHYLKTEIIWKLFNWHFKREIHMVKLRSAWITWPENLPRERTNLPPSVVSSLIYPQSFTLSGSFSNIFRLQRSRTIDRENKKNHQSK